MFSSEFPRSATVGDSNIPVPRRSHAGTKKSRGCAQLPELQRYIDTIIKANSECESREAATTEGGKRRPNERKFGRYSDQKGNCNVAKSERAKRDSRMSPRISKNKAKTPFTEAVSNGDEISKVYFYDSEDPRNWKTDDTQSGGAKPEVENFLKKVFPNPYDLECVNTDITPEKKQKDDLGDETLAHVPNITSNAHTQTEVESEKTDNASVTADGQIKPCARGSHMNCSIDPAFDPASFPENGARPVSRKRIRRGSDLSVEFKSRKHPASARILRENRSSTSTINISTQPSSLESVSDVFSSHTHTITSKGKRSRENGELVSSKSSMSAAKRRSSTEDCLDDLPSDYDIGKLKLLNGTDSEDSILRNLDMSEVRTSKHRFQLELSRTSGDGCVPDNLGDSQRMFDVMNEAIESFLAVSLAPKTAGENEQPVEHTTDLNEREETRGKNMDDDRQSQRDEEDRECGKECPELEEPGTENREKSPENDEARGEDKGAGSCTVSLLPKKENTNLTEPDSRPRGDEEQTESLAQPTDKSATVTDSEQEKTVGGENSGENIDEVLEFMYKCMKKFSEQEKRSKESHEASPEEKKEIGKDDPWCENESFPPPWRCNNDAATTQGSSESLPASSPAKETQSQDLEFSLDSKRKPNARLRSRKKLDRNYSLPVTELPPVPAFNGRTGTRLETHSRADSPGVTSLNRVHTVESQNELGSYSEQAQVLPGGCDEGHTPKSILPHSVKLKKSKTLTQKTIKDVLDSEEKLLESYLNSRPAQKKSAEKAGDSKSRKLMVRSGRASAAYPFFSDFKRHNSNFIICVSSLPRSLRTMSANRTSLTLSPSLSLSLNHVSRAWDVESLLFYPKMYLMKKIPIIADIGRSALEFSQSITQGKLAVVNKSLAAHIAMRVCLKATVGSSKLGDDVSLKASECPLSVRVRPMKKSLFVESSSTSNECALETGLQPALTNGHPDADAESSQRVESLLEALEKTEGRLLLLEQNECINSESGSTCSGNEVYRRDNGEIDWDGQTGHEKIHDLLQRTYNLQHKLHQYLHKMTCVQPSLPVCPLAYRERCSLFGGDVSDPNAPDVKRKKSEVACWQSFQQLKLAADESRESGGILTTEQGTSYSPPPADSKNHENSTDPETKDEREEENENEDDDNSSVCSFKSSNDFSEATEVANENDARSPEEVNSKELLQQIFSEIESFKHNFSTTEKDDKQSSTISNQEISENVEERGLVEKDPKMAAKVLKTVFRGKKSVTELTIGLKDVPMTEVSNISVEKRKFSANHTKISICILKQKPEAQERTDSNENSAFPANSNVLHNKYSALYFDQIRPSLSTCPTDSSRAEDDIAKMSTSLQETSDEDDDYKSVVSSFSIPDVTIEQKETKAEPQKPSAPPTSKTFTKYRFDFYRKMDLSLDPPKPKPLSSTVCRYKEFEPLKQALTEMQIRMRSIKQDTFFSSNDYYERALKLAKMSAGYCQSCGNRAVIPKDTFGYYKTLLPRRHSNHRHARHFKMSSTSNPSFYSFPSTNPDVSNRFCDLKHSSSHVLNRATRPPATFLRSSFHDIPILIHPMQ